MEADARSGQPSYAIAFAGLVALTQALIVLGALVRAHGAGLACPDWPLCFGELVPEMNLEVAFEWSHRVLAGGVSLLFLALAVCVLRTPGSSPAARRWIAVAAVLLAVQILLGALTVWELLAAWTVTSHLVTGNAFALALLLVALSLHEHARGGRTAPRAAGGVRTALAAVAAMLAIQMVLGGLVSSRFAGLACPDWPACRGDAWLPTWRGPVGLHLLHRWNGTLLAGAAVAAAWIARREPAVRRPAALAAVLAVLQVVVGVANVLLVIPVEVTGLHSALAAALVLAIGAATRAAWLRPTAGQGG